MKFDCDRELHPNAIEGFYLFNAGKFFESHEALETAWRDEKEGIRSLYQGILQVAVCYLHITRRNYNGALKLHDRSIKWLKDFPDVCRGVQVAKLRRDVEAVANELKKLGAQRINEFDPSLFKPVEWIGWNGGSNGISK